MFINRKKAREKTLYNCRKTEKKCEKSMYKQVKRKIKKAIKKGRDSVVVPFIKDKYDYATMYQALDNIVLLLKEKGYTAYCDTYWRDGKKSKNRQLDIYW